MLAMTSPSHGGAAGGDISDAAEWLRVYQQVEGTMEEATNELNDAAGQRAMGNRQKRALNKRVSESRESVARLERSLAAMERAPMRFKIGEGEIARRKGLLASVRSQTDRLEAELGGGGMGRGGPARRPVNLAEESAESQATSNVQIYAAQRSALSAQDEKLDGILDGVSRLKVMSNDINQELDLHANLLGELDSAVDSTDARLQRNTKRIEIVQEESSGCCGLLTMGLLFALLIILLVTNWGCHVFKPSKC